MNDINVPKADMSLPASLEYGTDIKKELPIEKKRQNTRKVMVYAVENAHALLSDKNKLNNFIANLDLAANYLIPNMKNEQMHGYPYFMIAMVKAVKEDKRLLKKLVENYAIMYPEPKIRDKFNNPRENSTPGLWIAAESIRNLQTDQALLKKVYLKALNRDLRDLAQNYIKDKEFHKDILLDPNTEPFLHITSLKKIDNIKILQEYLDLTSERNANITDLPELKFCREYAKKKILKLRQGSRR